MWGEFFYELTVVVCKMEKVELVAKREHWNQQSKDSLLNNLNVISIYIIVPLQLQDKFVG
jgi:hypothetical protein